VWTWHLHSEKHESERLAEATMSYEMTIDVTNAFCEGCQAFYALSLVDGDLRVTDKVHD
jgi:hypothetical protein